MDGNGKNKLNCMQRRSLIKNALLGLAISLVPEILRPALPEIVEEELVEQNIRIALFGSDPYNYGKITAVWNIKITKDQEKILERIQMNA